jgi:hypothetical protein
VNGKSIRRTSLYALSVYSLKIEGSGWPGIRAIHGSLGPGTVGRIYEYTPLVPVRSFVDFPLVLAPVLEFLAGRGIGRELHLGGFSAPAMRILCRVGGRTR